MLDGVIVRATRVTVELGDLVSRIGDGASRALLEEVELSDDR